MKTKNSAYGGGEVNTARKVFLNAAKRELWHRPRRTELWIGNKARFTVDLPRGYYWNMPRVVEHIAQKYAASSSVNSPPTPETKNTVNYEVGGRGEGHDRLS